MNNETPADLARILGFAATYMEEHGRARFRFGGRPGHPACPVAAIALALGIKPRRVGHGWFFRIGNEAHRAVGTVILRSGLLSQLPVPSRPYGRLSPRPANMSPVRAVHELARWSDDKTLDRVVIEALRDQARGLVTPRSRVLASMSSPAAASVSPD
jgi:hypothetical protein